MDLEKALINHRSMLFSAVNGLYNPLDMSDYLHNKYRLLLTRQMFNSPKMLQN